MSSVRVVIATAKMLHHYNYSTTLSHFLNYRQMEDATSSENEHASPGEDQFKCKSTPSSEINGKSFTIAAILGLNSSNGDPQNLATDLSVQHHHHPSMSSCGGRLQLPVRHSSSAVGVTTTHYAVGHGGCTSRQAGEVSG